MYRGHLIYPWGLVEDCHQNLSLSRRTCNIFSNFVFFCLFVGGDLYAWRKTNRLCWLVCHQRSCNMMPCHSRCDILRRFVFKEDGDSIVENYLITQWATRYRSRNSRWWSWSSRYGCKLWANTLRRGSSQVNKKVSRQRTQRVVFGGETMVTHI